MVNTTILAELANAQGEAYVNGRKLPWTAAKPKDFRIFSLLMQGRSRDNSTFSSGTSIKTAFDPQIASTAFGPKAHAEDHRTAGGGTMFWMESPLAEYEWAKQIRWHDIHLQGGNPFDGGSGSQQFYNMLEKTEKDFRLDPIIKMEAALTAAPTAEMFTGDATGAYTLKSIFTAINEWDTVHYSSGGGEGLFPGMTTQQGLDPEDARFQRVDGFGGSQLACHKVTYSDIGTATIADGHILERFQYFLDTLGWDPAPMAGEWSDSMEVRPSAFLCSQEGKNWFQRTNRAHGELFAILAPYGDPAQSNAQFGGIPLLTSTAIRDAAVYPDISGGVSTASAADPVTEFDSDGLLGPRFYAIDPRHVKLYMHTERAWAEGPWESMAPVNKDIIRKLGTFLGNLHFDSIVTHGLLSPSADISGYAQMS